MSSVGKVIAVCISDRKGIQKTEVPSVKLIPDFGIEGDAHAGKWHRQVSLLGLEKIEAFRARGAQVEFGAFGENIIMEGFDLRALPVGTCMSHWRREQEVKRELRIRLKISQWPCWRRKQPPPPCLVLNCVLTPE